MCHIDLKLKSVKHLSSLSFIGKMFKFITCTLLLYICTCVYSLSCNFMFFKSSRCSIEFKALHRPAFMATRKMFNYGYMKGPLAQSYYSKWLTRGQSLLTVTERCQEWNCTCVDGKIQIKTIETGENVVLENQVLKTSKTKAPALFNYNYDSKSKCEYLTVLDGTTSAFHYLDVANNLVHEMRNSLPIRRNAIKLWRTGCDIS